MTTTLRPPPAIAYDAILTVRVARTEATRVVVVMRGEADAATTTLVSEVLSRVIADYAGDVVIDLAQLTFIDSATGRILAIAKDLLSCRGRHMAVRSPSRLAAIVLDVFGLTDLIETQVA